MSLLFLLTFLGCAADVTAEALDDGFGAGASAIWLQQSSSFGHYESIRISNTPGYCGHYQDFAHAWAIWIDALDEGGCAALEAPTADLVDRLAAVAYSGANTVELAPFGDVYEGEQTLDDEVYGEVTHIKDDYLDDAMKRFDAAGDPEDLCGLELNPSESQVETWELVDGEVVFDAVREGGTATGSAEGSMVQDDGSEGAFSAHFAAAWCEVDLSF